MSRQPAARHSEAPLYGPSEMWMSPPDAAMLDDCLERRMSVSAASNAGALINWPELDLVTQNPDVTMVARVRILS